MVSQWTVPDLEEYSSQTTSRLRHALSKKCEDVNKEHVRSQKKHPWQAFPLQSAIILDVIQLSTPSVSTLYDKHQSELTGSSTSLLTPSIPKDSQGDGFTGIDEQDDESSVAEHSTVEPEMGVEHHDMELLRGGQPVKIMVDNEVSGYTDWINFEATCSLPPSPQLQSPFFYELIGGSVSLEPVSRIRPQRIVRQEDIPVEGELTLTRVAEDAPHEILFVLIGRQGEEIQVRCQW